MVGAFGEVQVMDWNLAKVLGGFRIPRATAARIPTVPLATHIRSAHDTDGSETQAGSVLGTPAPHGPRAGCPRRRRSTSGVSVFGLGAILAVILTDQPPYIGKSAEGTQVMAARKVTTASPGSIPHAPSLS